MRNASFRLGSIRKVSVAVLLFAIPSPETTANVLHPTVREVMTQRNAFRRNYFLARSPWLAFPSAGYKCLQTVAQVAGCPLGKRAGDKRNISLYHSDELELDVQGLNERAVCT